MKKCPNCEKTFEDSMRFCQTDGTPLVEVVEEEPLDPYKTVVAGRDDIASAIPPADPFATMVASGSERKDESGDLLQLPEEYDASASASDASGSAMSEGESSGADESEDVLPPLPRPSDEFSQPPAESKQEDEGLPETLLTPPELPRFNEPSVTPPVFSDFSSPKEESNAESSQNVSSEQESGGGAMPSPFDDKPISDESSKPQDAWGGTPFGTNDPIPSPFGETPKSTFEPPPFKEPENMPNQNDPFSNEPQSPFGQQNDPFAQQQQQWNPPPAPVQNWQDQGLGSNTPFQPPMAGGGQNQTLPIVSLVFGILSVCCYISPITGLVALITGFMGMKNANNDPNQYGGKGLAIAGMIVGGVFFVLGVLYWLLIFLGVMANIAQGM